MELTNEEILVARARCDKSLLFFTKLFFYELRGQKFQTNWHHEVICNEFERVERYETTFLNINIPPRHSKTEIMLNFIARGIGMNPHSNWFYITGSDELRSETSVRIRDIVSSELFFKMYGVKLRKDMKARNLWRTEEGGGLKTATISGQITGFGAGQMTDLEKELREFEGAVCMDDLNKMDDAEKENANNDKINRLLINTVPSRVNSEDTPFIHISQRSGEEDATATLLDMFGNLLPPDKVTNLVLPVIIDGKPLWEDKMSMERIEAQRDGVRTAATFSTQYMQDPQSPNDKPFHKNKLKWFDYEEIESIKQQSEGCLSYCDPKDDGTDYYAHPFGHLIGEVLYITEAIHSLYNTEITIAKSIEKIKGENCDYTSIETNSMGSMVWKQVRNGVEKQVYAVRNQTNKMTRIATNEAFIIKNMAFCKDHPDTDYQSFIEKLTKFEYGKAGKPDDAPDATAGLATLTMARYRHLFK